MSDNRASKVDRILRKLNEMEAGMPQRLDLLQENARLMSEHGRLADRIARMEDDKAFLIRCLERLVEERNKLKFERNQALIRLTEHA